MLIGALALAMAIQDSPPLEMRLMRYPAVHGENVVFTYAGDLWISKRDGGFARRLTSHPGQEYRARISPDGKLVAFTGQYDGNNDVFVIPITGGEPKRLSFDPESDNVINWSPDGKIMFASTAGNFIQFQQRMWLVDPEGGPKQETPVMEITEGSMAPDGRTLVYTRKPSYNYNWRRYRGGTQGVISVFNLDTLAYSELPSGREQNYFPMYVSGSVYYISDKNLGTLNLYKYDMSNRRETQLTRFSDADIKFPSTDGKTIVFERDGYLFTYDIASGDIAKLTPLVRSDFVPARPQLQKLGGNIQDGSLSPSAVRVVAEARGEIFSIPAKAGETRNLTNTSGARERWPRWSPDGKTIAYVSDRTGYYEVYTQPQLGGDETQLTTARMPISQLEWTPDSKYMIIGTEANELYVLDVASKNLKRVYKARYGLGAYDVSPDSKWIAYIDQAENGFGMIHLYNIESGESRQVTDYSYDDSQVAFDLNGKYLYLISTRTFTPSFGSYEFSLKVEDAQRIYVIPLTKDIGNPLLADPDEETAGQEQQGGGPGGAPGKPEVKVDFDGIGERLLPLPMGASNYPFIVGVNNGVLYFGGGNIMKFDMGSRESQTIFSGPVSGLSFNPNRTKMAYMAQGALGIVDVRPGQNATMGRVSTANVEAVIDPRDEWKQIFWEAWRFQKFNFYDPDMLGLNWEAIGKRYEAYLPYVSHRGDLNYVLGLMVGELGTGHAYVGGGDMGPMPPPIPVGQLGADYEIVGNNVRFKKIYRGSNYQESWRGPLGEPGVEVRDGEYLLAIDGKTVDRNTNPDELMMGKVNRTVVLTVNSTPSMTGARKVRVRPVGSEAQLRYAEWVEENRRKVEAASGGRIGYMHVPNTAFEGAVEFIRGYYRETGKDAVIVDERWNGGGYIQPWFVDTLARSIKSGIQQRNAQDATDAVAIEGPKAMLINEYAGSGGDFFPWMFKQAKLGPLIGKRTWGGLVGISGGAPLVDGGSVTSPEFALYDRATNTIIAENTGVDPDIEVDLRPDLLAKGQDPQLEAAIKYLMGELAKMPPKKERTTIPKIGRGGGK